MSFELQINHYFVCLCGGFHPSCPPSCKAVPPLCSHSDNLHVLPEKDDGSVDEKRNKEGIGSRQEEKKNGERSLVPQQQLHQKQQQQQRFLSTARGLFQGNAFKPGLAGSNFGIMINQRQIFSLEPFHQSSIINSRLKRGREEKKEEHREKEDMTAGNSNKKTKLTSGESFHKCSFKNFL